MQPLSWLGRLFGGGPSLDVAEPATPLVPGESATVEVTLSGLNDPDRIEGIAVALRVYQAATDAETTVAETELARGEFVDAAETRTWTATLDLPATAPATSNAVEAVVEANARFDERRPLSAVAYPSITTQRDVAVLKQHVESVGLHDGGVRTTIRPTERAPTAPGGGDDLPAAILATDPVAVQAYRFYPLAYRYDDAIDEVLVIPWLEETGATLYVRARYADAVAAERDTEWATVDVPEIPEDEDEPSMEALQERLAEADVDADSPEALLAELEAGDGDPPAELAGLLQSDEDESPDPIVTGVDDLLEGWADRVDGPS